ncbi:MULTISPECIES: DNA adenine methylase [Cyanophyceae]|uniref:DNA adenine methylase n=2 Tax=Cyanobacteriota TaxID=1117 RepID=UPI00233094EC|nr:MULTISPECIES: DNA adenine methylase [Cyanophyceae]MDB9358119.1 DNA adenine methylase [Nodularia spumigena CS-587/03]MDB9306898.1 DNA adenine methylase [Nodularia spumigena CS-591/12]MDB9318136.1 DNA adenine methylase [Nodularia spumigena CS-590/01A]MDB9323691.1 DNA adenine methylase [Nodularia spumigena CS-591/07A]MDB9329410.1 DNA adenine methylase [Nodularia spumigena CS-591/04]
MIKSPLRYPGGKSKAIKQIAKHLPDNFSEFREPFVGGGSVFIYLKQKFPHLKIWINDLNRELFLFWKYTQSHLPQLVEEIRRVKDKYTDGKILFKELTTIDTQTLSDFERAARFFILNRITFSGTVESGGFSEQAFHKRFTYSSIERLEKLAEILTDDVKITNLDYSELLDADGKNVFIFLDPPYFAATKSRLYGKDGDLHTTFEHQRFAELLRECDHRWLITYDDSPQIRENFHDAHLFEWELQYGMNNYKQGSAAKGKELFITNFAKNNQDFSDHQQLNLEL